MKALRTSIVLTCLSTVVLCFQTKMSLSASVDPSPFCQTRQTTGSVAERRIEVSPDVLPLLSKVKWGSLSVEGAWELAAQVFSLSGPMPAALMADEQSRAIVKGYIDDIWARGRFNQKPRYTFSARDAADFVTSQNEREARPDALVRFLEALTTAYHETIHYLQMDRCDSLRLASIDKSGFELVILPIGPTAYLAGRPISEDGRSPSESSTTVARTLIDEGVIGPCRANMDVIAETYFPKGISGSLAGALREAQAKIMDAELASGLSDRLQIPLQGRNHANHVEAGTFLVFISATLESLRGTPGAWEALRASGTDHTILWLMNVAASTWRYRGSTDSGDYPCGRLIFGSALDTAREFVSTAGTPNKPNQWIGEFLSMPSTVKCQVQQVCAFKIEVQRPARLGYVDIGNKRLKFNRKTMEVSGKLPRAGSTPVQVTTKVGKSVYTAEIWVSTT